MDQLFEPFTRAFVAPRTEAIRLGNALDFEHDMGSLMNLASWSGSARMSSRESQGGYGADRWPAA